MYSLKLQYVFVLNCLKLSAVGANNLKIVNPMLQDQFSAVNFHSHINC